MKWPKSRDLLSNDAGQEDMLRPTGLPISRASVNGRTVQPRAASFTARQIETISTIKVQVREENSQCNYQAVDAQRFHERKSQTFKRPMMAHSVWMNGVQAANLSCNSMAVESYSAVLLSNVHPCPVWVPRRWEPLHPSHPIAHLLPPSYAS